jgi:Rad3-related DNA helicase
VELLPEEGLWSCAEQVRKYLALEDSEVQIDLAHRESLLQQRLGQAIGIARSAERRMDERMMVARTVREYLQQELEKIDAQLKGTIEDRLKELANRKRNTVVQKLNETNALLKQLQEQRGKLPFMDRMKLHGQEIVSDFKESDWKVKTGYIVGLGVGFLLARWAYKKIRGNSPFPRLAQ